MSISKLNKYRVSDQFYTHQSLKGGKWNIPEKEMVWFHKMMLQNPELSICEKLPETFQLYFDLDGLDETYDLEEMLIDAEESIEKYIHLEKNGAFVKHILVNKSKPRNFHVYYPNIVVNKTMAKNLCKLLNMEMLQTMDIKHDDEIFDSAAYNSCFRMYGTLKYNNKLKCCPPDSNYVFLYPEKYTDVKESAKLALVSVRQHIGEELSDVTSEWIDFAKLKSKKNKATRGEQKYPEGQEGEESDDDEDYVDEETEDYLVREYYQEELTRNRCEKMKYILNKCLSKNRVDDYDSWVKVVYLLKNLGIPREIADQWSNTVKDRAHNDRASIDAIYASGKVEHQLTVRALITWCMEDNERAFRKIIWGVSEFEYVDHLIPTERLKKYFMESDLGDSKLFKEMYKNRIVCTEIGKGHPVMYFWNGDIWEEDKKNFIKILICEKMSDIYSRLLKSLLYAKNNGEEGADEFLIKQLQARIPRILTNGYTVGVMPFLANKLFNQFIREKFDAKHDYLSVKNGLINLKTGEIRPRQYSDYNTFFIETSYQGLDYSTSNVQQFFDEITVNRKLVTDYLQKFLGYSLTGHVSEQKFSIFHGIGSNGKSQLLRVLTDLLEDGKYIAALSGDALSAKFKDGAATTQYNCLEGTRIAYLDESDKDTKINEGLVKRLTGGTKLRIRRLYKEEHSINITAQILLITNHKPKISDDYAFHRRLILVPFDAKFIKPNGKTKFNPNDPTHFKCVPENIMAERITSQSLLTWLVQGAMAWYRESLDDIPQRLTENVNKYINMSDDLRRFIEEECTPVDSKDATLLSDFHGDYQSYIAPKKISLQEFRDNLEERKIDMIIKEENGKRVRYVPFVH